MKPITYFKKRYASNVEDVKEYMNDLLDKLENDFGTIDPAWSVQLDMICDWYNMYSDAVAKLKSQGVTYLDDKGHVCKNPNFDIMKSATNQINGILKTFATDPVSKSRINYLKQRGCIEYDEDAVLDEWTK